MKIIRTLCIGSAAASLLLGTASSAFAAGSLTSAEGRILIDSYDVAGNGYFDEWNGEASTASFRHPMSVIELPDGSVAVADTFNHRIRLIQDGGVSVYSGPDVSVLFDDANLPVGALADGAREFSFYNHPVGIAADAAGNLYVADRDNHAIRKIAKNGSTTTLAGNGVLGAADGLGKEASFYAPSDVAVAADGTVYVADTLNHLIRRIDPEGNVTTLNAASQRFVEVIGGVVEPAGDYADGDLASALFNEPSGLALDAEGNLFVSDTGNQRIRYIDLAAGTVRTVAGGGEYENQSLYVEGFYINGSAADARFYSPRGLAVDADGGLLIADSLNHSIRYLKDGQVSTVVGDETGEYGMTNGVEETTLLDTPTDVAIAEDGSLLIADMYNGKIRKAEYYALPSGITADGTIKVVYAGEKIAFDAPPIIRNNRTFVPVRAIAEAMGYEVSFAGEAIQLEGGDNVVTLTVGALTVESEVDGVTESRTIDAAPFIDDSRTYVPVRFFAEQIAVDVEWDGATASVVLRDKMR
ncbi:stalk domain-containing protein [Paenibacillus sp. TRM 82003]|nr:stalk domain-containing protein [Paenibacillus sp. TRM 82003]